MKNVVIGVLWIYIVLLLLSDRGVIVFRLSFRAHSGSGRCFCVLSLLFLFPPGQSERVVSNCWHVSVYQ